jgi:hypothetical protein
MAGFPVMRVLRLDVQNRVGIPAGTLNRSEGVGVLSRVEPVR